MLITTFVACTRAQRGQYLAHIFRVAGKRVARRLRRWCDRIAQASRHRHDLAMLLADDRMLRDIGLTRADVRYAASGKLWTGSSRALTSAAVWREETSTAGGEQGQKLPHIDAPNLAPTLPQAMLHENFR